MERSDFLFDLVKRLDEREHRFVVQFAQCGRKRPEKVLELLDAIMALKHYDRIRLETKFVNLNITRFHLRQLILRAMRAYRDGESADSKIRGMIIDYEILYEKGFYEEAFASLNKAQELAQLHQNVGRLLEIHHWQKHRLLELETSHLPKLMHAHVVASQNALAAYNQQINLVNDYHQLFADYRTEDRPKTPAETPMQDMEMEALDRPEVPVHTRLYAYMRASMQARHAGKLALARQYLERALSLWDAHPEIKKDLINNYKITLANYAVYLFPEGRLDEVRALVAQILEIPDRNFNEEAETFQNIANLRILLELNSKSTSSFEPLVKEIEEGLVKYAIKINAARQFSIWYNLMLLYLIHQDFRKARSWIDRILEHRRFDIRKEVQYITRLLELLIYYELEIWDTPESTVMAVYRYLSRKDELTPFKREVLSNFTKLSSLPIHDRKDQFTKLYDKLRNHTEAGSTADGLGLQVVTAWAGSKISGKSILEALTG